MAYPFTNNYYTYRHPSPLPSGQHRLNLPTYPFSFEHRPTPRAIHPYPSQSPSDRDLDSTFVPHSERQQIPVSQRHNQPELVKRGHIDIDEEERLLNARLAQLRALRQKESARPDCIRAPTQNKARIEAQARAQAEARAYEETLRSQHERQVRLRSQAQAIRQYEEEEKAYRAAAAAAAALVEAEAQAEAEAKERAKIAERVARARAYQMQQQQSQRQYQDEQTSWIQEERQSRKRETEIIEAIVRAQRAQELEEMELEEQRITARARAQAQTEMEERARQAAIREQVRSREIAAEEESRRACHPQASPQRRSPAITSSAATKKQSRALTQEEMEKKFWRLVFGGTEEEEKEKKEQEQKASEVRRPASPIVHVCPQPSRSESVMCPAPQKPVSSPTQVKAINATPVAEQKSELEHLRGVADFLKQAFGVNVTLDYEEPSNKEVVRPDSPKQQVASAPAPQPIRSTAMPASSATSPPAKTEESKRPSEHSAPVDARDQLAHFLRNAFVDATKPEGRTSEAGSRQQQQEVPDFLGNLLSAFSGAAHRQHVGAEPAKDVKGKGRAQDESAAQPKAESSSAGAWAGLTAQEKEESKAIERSYEQKKEEAVERTKGTAPPLAPVAVAPDDAEEAEAAKPAETLRTAYNRNANRVARLEQLDSLSSRLERLIGGFTFPETLDFQSPTSSAPSSPSLDPVESAAAIEQPQLRVPPLAFSHNNQPYHSQAQGLMQLLTEADAIPSEGDKQVRKARKEFVKAVEAELGRMEVKRGDIWRAQSKAAEEEESMEVKREELRDETAVQEPNQAAVLSPEFASLQQDSNVIEADVAKAQDAAPATEKLTGEPTSGPAPTTTSGMDDTKPSGSTLPEAAAPEQSAVTKSPNLVTIEDVPDEEEESIRSKNRALSPPVSIIEPLPAPAVVPAVVEEPEFDAGNSSQSFSSSGSESGDSDEAEWDESKKVVRGEDET